MAKQKTKVRFDAEIIENSGPVYSQRCDRIVFESNGTADATLLGVIPVNQGDEPRAFEVANPAEEEIDQHFPIQFASTGTKSIIVIRRWTGDSGINQS